jgi:hypothetical protein
MACKLASGCPQCAAGFRLYKAASYASERLPHVKVALCSVGEGLWFLADRESTTQINLNLSYRALFWAQQNPSKYQTGENKCRPCNHAEKSNDCIGVQKKETHYHTAVARQVCGWIEGALRRMNFSNNRNVMHSSPSVYSN